MQLQMEKQNCLVKTDFPSTNLFHVNFPWSHNFCQTHDFTPRASLHPLQVSRGSINNHCLNCVGYFKIGKNGRKRQKKCLHTGLLKKTFQQVALASSIHKDSYMEKKQNIKRPISYSISQNKQAGRT